MNACWSILPVLALCIGCTQRPSPAPTRAQQAQAIAEVFETKVEYTVHHLDSATVQAFLAAHPDARADSAVIVDFYQRRGYQYAWFVNDSLSSAAGNLLALIGATDSMLGTGPDDYEQARALVSGLMSGDMTDVGREAMRDAELALTARFFRFADTRYGGFVQRDVRDLDWYIPRRKKNVDRLLDSLAAGRMDLSAYEPVHPQYQLLKQELKRYYALQQTGDGPPLVLERKSYRLGDSAAVLVAVRDRLFRLGDLAANDSSAHLDSTLAAGVRSFQQRVGLGPSGVVDAAFAEELGRPIEDRIRQILVNMERLRWVNPEPPKDFLLVNIPEYRLHVYEDGAEAWAMDVVVGATATRTVIFSGDLSLIVFAPYWNVPQSIVRSEILPAVKRNSSYLAKKDMEVVKGGSVVPASGIDWSAYTSGVPFTIRQKPGPQNALGRVKFLFPNEYSIYLHDTPSKSRFAADKRAFSHGCIRLSDPARLAEYLLRSDSTWTPQRIAKAMNGRQETTVKLVPPMPVTIGYFTAWVDVQGRLNFRDDVYGNDAKLAQELFMDGEEVAER